MDKQEKVLDSYEEWQKVFYKFVDEINAFYKTLPDNLVLKTNINGLEFFYKS